MTALHPGDEGRVQVVSLRTATTILRKPIVKVVKLLEAEVNEQVNEGQEDGTQDSQGK